MQRERIKLISLVFLVFFMLATYLVSPANVNSARSDNSDLQQSISSLEKKLESEQKAKQQLEQQLNQIQYTVNKNQWEINKTQGYIKDTEQTISRKEEELKLKNEKVELQRKLLASLVREMYYKQRSPVETIMSESEKFSQFLGGSDYISFIGQKISNLIEDIKSSKDQIEQEKSNLEGTINEHERLLDLKKDQQQDLASDKYETQGDLQEKQATIAELQAKLSKLQGELSGLLGKSYNASDIEDAAKFAAKRTGVRKDFILGMLVVESDLGRFTGGCYAKDSRMSGTRLSLFKKICSELDYNWAKRKVSCPPKGYTGTGGAMGVAQFMSDTWMGYKSSIALNTGHKTPDPWNLTDGVMAMGLKLAKGGATKKSGECNAAKLYLSGTTSSKYNWYCQKVLYWADNYESKMGS